MSYSFDVTYGMDYSKPSEFYPMEELVKSGLADSKGVIFFPAYALVKVKHVVPTLSSFGYRDWIELYSNPAFEALGIKVDTSACNFPNIEVTLSFITNKRVHDRDEAMLFAGIVLGRIKTGYFGGFKSIHQSDDDASSML